VTATPLAIGSVSLRLYPHDRPAAEQLDLVRMQAQLAVDAGFDGVMVSEHHADFPGYLPNPIQMSGFLLAAMSHGWAAPCPLLLPMQPYALVAEQIAWLAAAYPGRVGAGFASGALPVDFQLAEVPFEEISTRFKAALPLVVAALRGEDTTPLGQDRAVRACAEHPIPMVVAAQSPAAVKRAARLGLGILYDSLQTVEVTKRLSDLFDEAGGTGPKILIRRVWIGDPPRAEIDAQMQHYRSYAPESAMKNWGDGNSLVHGGDAVEAAENLAAVLTDANCDTLNVRVHVKGLTPEQVAGQLDQHGSGFLPHLRSIWAPAAPAA
jgi:alkanesulfonate monooxygenase SsuD/methylene tetrahydromethanopterin reductase-like flavin-dependent oxidoreductase (luciferase family)